MALSKEEEAQQPSPNVVSPEPHSKQSHTQDEDNGAMSLATIILDHHISNIVDENRALRTICSASGLDAQG